MNSAAAELSPNKTATKPKKRSKRKKQTLQNTGAEDKTRKDERIQKSGSKIQPKKKKPKHKKKKRKLTHKKDLEDEKDLEEERIQHSLADIEDENISLPRYLLSLFRKSPAHHTKDIESQTPVYHRYKYHEPTQEDFTRFKHRYLRSWLFEFFTRVFLTKSFLKSFTPYAFFVIGLSIGVTMFCWHFKLHTDVPITLWAASVIFPISFGISYTMNRREVVLRCLADMKTSAIGMYQIAREISIISRAVPREGDEDTESMQVILQRKLRVLFKEIKIYLGHLGGTKSLNRIYLIFDEIWCLQDQVDIREEYTKGVLSRLYQFHRFMMVDFEQIKTLYEYRTASSLRGYGFIWLTILPLVFGPYFAFYAITYGWGAGVFVAVITSMLLVTLHNVQDTLEDPFTGTTDAFNLSILKEVEAHLY